MKLQCEYDTDMKVSSDCGCCYHLKRCPDGVEETCDDFLPENWWKGYYNYINGTWYWKKEAEWVPM